MGRKWCVCAYKKFQTYTPHLNSDVRDIDRGVFTLDSSWDIQFTTFNQWSLELGRLQDYAQPVQHMKERQDIGLSEQNLFPESSSDFMRQDNMFVRALRIIYRLEKLVLEYCS